MIRKNRISHASPRRPHHGHNNTRIKILNGLDLEFEILLVRYLINSFYMNINKITSIP